MECSKGFVEASLAKVKPEERFQFYEMVIIFVIMIQLKII